MSGGMPPDMLADDIGGRFPAQFRVWPDVVVIMPPGIDYEERMLDLNRSTAAQLSTPFLASNLLQRLEVMISVEADRLIIDLPIAALRTLASGNDGSGSHAPTNQPTTIRIIAHTSLRRRGHELKLVHAVADRNPARRDERLLQILASAQSAWHELLASPHITQTRRSHPARLARLKFLAPDIITAILDERQPAEVSSRSLLKVANLPIE